jgi:hypothetical protein
MMLFNRGVTAVFDLLLYPLRWLPPVAGLAAVAFVSAVVALIVVKRTSNQSRIRDAKNGMYAALLEMRLFNEDLGAILRASIDVLASNARYLRASLVPVLWLIVPFGLLVTHLDAFYANGGLTVSEHALVTAHVRGQSASGAPQASLDVPAGLTVDTSPVWFPALGELVWRITPDREGTYALEVHDGAETATKTVVVSDAVVRRSPARVATGWLNDIASPSEPPLPDTSAFDALTVSYPAREVTALGWHLPWLVIYGGFLVVFALSMGRVFHVEI